MLNVKNPSRFINLYSKSYLHKLKQYSKTRFGYRKRMTNHDLLNLYAVFENNNFAMFNGSGSLFYSDIGQSLYCYQTKISEKFIEDGIEVIYINNFSKKLGGQFHSKTLSGHIHMLIKLCKEAQIPYRIIFNEDKFLKAIEECESTECSICLEETEESYCKIKNCNHIFHIKCINKWYSSHNSCPYCRSPIVSNSTNNFDEIIFSTNII
tara:strand:+ start:74 stop:700 length:627 start_codon:yes stop_codon:yes gene_type:complete